MASAKLLLRDLWPAVAWVQGSCAWAAQSLLAHSPSEPVQLSSPAPPPARWRCSLIATGMALDRLLRVLSPTGSTLQSGGPADAAVSCLGSSHSRPTAAHLQPGGPAPAAGQNLGSSVPCRPSAAAHPGSSSQPRDVSCNHGHLGAVPFPDSCEQAANLPTVSDATAWPVHAAGWDRQDGLGDEGEGWRVAQQALLALLEQEHAAGSAAHAWQVSGFSFLSTGACQIGFTGGACNLEL